MDFLIYLRELYTVYKLHKFNTMNRKRVRKVCICVGGWLISSYVDFFILFGGWGSGYVSQRVFFPPFFLQIKKANS